TFPSATAPRAHAHNRNPHNARRRLGRAPPHISIPGRCALRRRRRSRDTTAAAPAREPIPAGPGPVPFALTVPQHSVLRDETQGETAMAPNYAARLRRSSESRPRTTPSAESAGGGGFDGDDSFGGAERLR